MIQLGELPEQVIFTLEDGNKLIVSHKGNRLEVVVRTGQPLIIHPKSGNSVALTIGDSRKLSKPLDEEWLLKNLPPTSPRTNPRPGAEYGVKV